MSCLRKKDALKFLNERDAKEQSAAASGLADVSSHPTPTETSEHVDGVVPRTDHEGTSSPNHEGTSSPNHDDPSASVQGEDTTTDKPTKAAPKAGASRSHRSHSQSTNHPDGPHCIPGCKHRKGRGGGDMVRCCLCMAWYHIKCLEISNDETLGFWSCFVCRHLGDDLRTTNEKLDLSSEMERAVTLFTRTLRETQQERDVAVNEVSALKTENAVLREQITALTRENTRLVYENQRAQERQSNGKTLLIGSSLIRNIDENRIMNTEVVCLRGAKVCDIHRELNEKSDNKTIKYGNIILMCGGNNCAASNPDISSIATDFKELIATAKSVAMQVTVCSIPPRLEPSHAGEAISSLNAALQSLCSDLKVHFANQHDLFHLQNGSVNDGYLADNVHLTLKGSDAMARTIGLKLRPGHTGASVNNPKQSPSLTWRQKKTKAPQSRPSSDQRTDSDTGEYFTRDIDSHFIEKARTKSVRNNGNATGRKTGRAPQHKERTPKNVGKAQYHQRGTYTSHNTYNGNRHRGNEQYETTQRCGFCSEPNHNSRNCRHGQSIICHECQAPGHKAKYCYGQYRSHHYHTSEGNSFDYWGNANEGSADSHYLSNLLVKDPQDDDFIMQATKQYCMCKFLSFMCVLYYMSSDRKYCFELTKDTTEIDPTDKVRCAAIPKSESINSETYPPVCIEKNNIAAYLENGEFWSVFQINKSIGDGHCFIYSLCKSCNTQFSDEPTLSGTELLDMIKIETTENYDYYVLYLNDGSFADLIKQMEMYVYDKIYDIRYGDIVPLTAANALKRDIFYHHSHQRWYSWMRSCLFRSPMWRTATRLYPQTRGPLWCSSACNHDCQM